MIKIIIIVLSSILWINYSHATVDGITTDLGPLKYPLTTKLIGNFLLDFYIIILSVSILTGTYIHLLYLSIPILLSLVNIDGQLDTFIESFSHDTLTTCNECNKILLYKNEHCEEHRKQFVKEEI